MSSNLQDQSLCLPLDLWRRVLKLLESATAKLSLTGDSYEDRLCAQSLFWQLPGVCKTFRDTFRAYPELGCQNIAVGALNRSKRLTSTTMFLHSHAAAIQCLDTGSSSDNVMRYFGALSHIPDTLQTAKLQVKGPDQFGCLAPFTSLVSLFVRLDNRAFYQGLDLAPLQQLHQLSHLSVDYAWCGIPNFTSLTHLDLRGCRVHCLYGGFAETFIKMTMDECEVKELHLRGLSGCTALQSLSLRNYCGIRAKDSREDCVFSQQAFESHLPAGMSDLTALTHLHLHPTSCRAGTLIDFGALLDLACLQSLELTMPHSITFDSTFSRLALLTSLYIKATGTVKGTSQEYLHLSRDMQAMQSLQKLVVDGTFTASSGALGLLLLQTIKHVNFRDSVPADDQTCKLVGQLQTGFVNRVDVLFEMYEYDLTHYTMAQKLQVCMSTLNAAHDDKDFKQVISGPSDDEWLQWV